MPYQGLQLIAAVVWMFLGPIAAAQPQDKPDLLAEARRIRRLAVEEARKVGDGLDKNVLFSNIALLQARAGDFQDAFETAHSLPEPERSLALESVARAQAEKGDVAAAMTTAGAIKDVRSRADALSEAAVAQARAGDFRTAVATVKMIEDSPSSSGLRGFLLIAHFQNRAGDKAGAARTLREAAVWIILKMREGQRSDAHRRFAISSLASIASMQSRMGDARSAAETREEMRKILEEIQNPATRDSALASTVRALAASGDFVFAREIAEQMKQGGHRDSALASIAEEEARAGNLPAARGTIDTMEAPSEIARARTSVGLIQTNQGDPLGAIQTASSISDPKARAEALIALAGTFARKKQGEPAVSALAQGLEAAQIAGKEKMEPQFWRDVVGVQAWSGNVLDALQTTRRIQDEASRAWAIQFVTHKESAAGDWRLALSWAEEETSPLVRAYALLGVADGLRARLVRTNAIK